MVPTLIGLKKIMNRKGIILAGGSGTRLYPLTQVVSKQLMPIYDKPMIYYPLSTLMLAGIRDILIISTPHDLPNFEKLLGDGSNLGISIKYAIQKSPEGIAQALIIAEPFLNNQQSALILGDNIFYGHDLQTILDHANKKNSGATIFAYHVHNPQEYGVVQFDKEQKAISLEEKPKDIKSNYAITGLYFYDNNASQIAKSLKPSSRGELEITDLNRVYLDSNNLNVEILKRGYAWLDTGTHDSLLDAGEYISIIQKKQGFLISCLEEISFRQGWMSADDVLKNADKIRNSPYGKYLINFIKEN
jgi:glucose-1-phosphate thymidylyltransferase